MKPYNERLPLIDAAIEATDGDIERIKDYRKTDTYINYTVKLGYFSVDNQWAVHGETICTHDEYEKRARELGYKPKEQEMNNDWYEKGELPPVGEVVAFHQCNKYTKTPSISSWKDGDELEVLAHKQGEIEPVAVVWNHRDKTASGVVLSCLKPLRTETDKLVEQAMNLFHETESTTDAKQGIEHAVHKLIEAGWRPTKPMSEDEFIDASELDHDTGLLLYRAGCRFLDQGE